MGPQAHFANSSKCGVSRIASEPTSSRRFSGDFSPLCSGKQTFGPRPGSVSRARSSPGRVQTLDGLPSNDEAHPRALQNAERGLTVRPARLLENRLVRLSLPCPRTTPWPAHDECGSGRCRPSCGRTCPGRLRTSAKLRHFTAPTASPHPVRRRARCRAERRTRADLAGNRIVDRHSNFESTRLTDSPHRSSIIPAHSAPRVTPQRSRLLPDTRVRDPTHGGDDHRPRHALDATG